MVVSIAIFSIGFIAVEATSPNHISVYGESVIEVEPDNVQVTVGVETEANQADHAVAENAEQMNAVLASLANYDSEVSSATSGNYQLRTIQGEQSSSYRVTNELKVTLNELELLGELIDLMVTAGANRVQSIHFGIENADQAKLDALAKAIEQARSKAEVMARAAGVELGEIISIYEAGGSYTPFQLTNSSAFTAAPAVATKIIPDNVELRARVELQYAILSTNDSQVSTELNTELGESLAELGEAIDPTKVVNVTLFDLYQEELRTLSEQETFELVDSLNNNPTFHGAYPMMLAGNQGTVTLEDQNEIQLTSFGSRDYVIVSGVWNGEHRSFVVNSGEVGALLLGDVY